MFRGVYHHSFYDPEFSASLLLECRRDNYWTNSARPLVFLSTRVLWIGLVFEQTQIRPRVFINQLPPVNHTHTSD